MLKKLSIVLCLGFALGAGALGAGIFPDGRAFAEDAPADASAAPPKQIIAPGTFENLLKAAIKLEAFDLNDDAVIDDFAKVVHCDIYQKYFPNEFDWRRVRVAMRQSIQAEMQTYPTLIYLERTEHVGKYDFSSGILELQPESIMRKTALLELSQGNERDFCGAKLTVLPATFIAALDNPIQLEGIELGEEEARTVVEGLQTVNPNDPSKLDRLAYGRYVVSLESVNPSPACRFRLPRI
jgi:hypothetical protein